MPNYSIRSISAAFFTCLFLIATGHASDLNRSGSAHFNLDLDSPTLPKAPFVIGPGSNPTNVHATDEVQLEASKPVAPKLLIMIRRKDLPPSYAFVEDRKRGREEAEVLFDGASESDENSNSRELKTQKSEEVSLPKLPSGRLKVHIMTKGEQKERTLLQGDKHYRILKVLRDRSPDALTIAEILESATVEGLDKYNLKAHYLYNQLQYKWLQEKNDKYTITSFGKAAYADMAKQLSLAAQSDSSEPTGSYGSSEEGSSNHDDDEDYGDNDEQDAQPMQLLEDREDEQPADEPEQYSPLEGLNEKLQKHIMEQVLGRILPDTLNDPSVGAAVTLATSKVLFSAINRGLMAEFGLTSTTTLDDFVRNRLNLLLQISLKDN